MPPRIDLRAIARLDITGRERRFRDLATVVAAEWRRKARNGLSASGADYANAVTIESADASGCRIVLGGTVPNIIENGMGPGGIGTTGPYDMRRFILKPGTKSLRRDAKGRLYVNIPFEHSAADIAKAGALTAAKSLRPARTRHGDFFRPPNSNLVDPKAMQARTKWGEGLGAQFGPRLAGLVRMEKIYSQATAGAPQTKFMTWRRMTEGGKGWISKGVAARRFAREVHRGAGNLMRLVGL